MKKLILNDQIKYRVVSRYTRNQLSNKLIENAKEELGLKEKVDRLKEKLNDLVKDYIVNEELKQMWERHPSVFHCTSGIYLDLHKLGLFDSDRYTDSSDGYSFSVMTGINISGIPVLSPINSYTSYYTLTKEDFDKFSESDQELLKDLLYEIIQIEYDSNKAAYRKDDKMKKVIDDGMTYKKLFELDPSLYEFAVVSHYSESYLVYEDDGVDKEVTDIKKVAQLTRAANMSKNEADLENLKNIIGL